MSNGPSVLFIIGLTTTVVVSTSMTVLFPGSSATHSIPGVEEFWASCGSA